MKEYKKAFWFSQVLPLLHFITRANNEVSREFAFVRYFEITQCIDNVNRVLNCICLQWAAGEQCNNTVSRNVQANDYFGVRERYVVTTFSSISSTHHIVRSDYCVFPFISQLQWPAHPFYVKKFNQCRQSRSLLNKPFYSITIKNKLF